MQWLMLGSQIIFLQVNGTLPSWPLCVPGLDLILIMKYLVTLLALLGITGCCASIQHRFDEKRERGEREGWYEPELSLYASGSKNKLTTLDTKYILFTPVTMIVGVTGPNLFARQQISERVNTRNWKIKNWNECTFCWLFLRKADMTRGRGWCQPVN